MNKHSEMWPILVVTKDKAEFLIYSRVVEALRKLGYRVYVIAEGLSMQEWVKIGEKLYGGVGELDAKGFRHDIDVPKVFDQLNPCLVLTGLGAPDHYGEIFGDEAKRRGKQVGVVEDVWGVHARSRVIPDFVCTLDGFAEQMILNRPTYAGRMPAVYITGIPSLDRLDQIDLGCTNFIDFQSFDLTIVLAGQDESTTPLIEGLAQAIRILAKAGKKILLLIRLHGKFRGREDLKAIWLPTLWGLSDVCTVVLPPPQIELAHLAGKADFVVSIYSGALIEAAVMGAIAVSWNSPVGEEKMAESMAGLTQYPMVTQGSAVEVRSAEEFIALVGDENRQREVRNRALQTWSNPGRTARVVDAIVAQLSRRS